jgi:BirA family biotin operon repressor/biotin-[acetyl-CoA-carboxylase] ligase
LEILYFDTLDSTQKHLSTLVELSLIQGETAVVASRQTKGIGSRNNVWQGYEGSLFFSCALNVNNIAKDIPIHAYSLYFGYIIKECIAKYKKEVWLKWPNDIYLQSDKVGGIITQKKENFFIVGLGLNLVTNSHYQGLELKIEKNTLVEDIVKSLINRRSWKEIFSKYKLEFDKSKEFETSYNEEKIAMSGAILEDDGSITVEGKRIYNLR